MKLRSLTTAAAAVVAAITFLFSATAMPSATMADAEYTFVVSQVNMTHMCQEMSVAVVNGQLPGPAIEVTEGDSVMVHIVNLSPYNMTIHWHGVRQLRNCWNDGVPMITQRPIQPNQNFTYRFDVVDQEGTLWWHAHEAFLRGTVHGEWWEKDLAKVGNNMTNGFFDDYSSGSTINGKLGDLFNCSGVPEESYVLDVEPGQTYLLRVINAALFSEYFLKIAGHKFTVVSADANYVNPFTTDTISIAPGETMDALVVADAPPGKYYMVALPSQAPPPDTQTPEWTTRALVKYTSPGNGSASSDDDVPEAPVMPDNHDTISSFYFHGNLTSLRHRRRAQVPKEADEHLFVVLGLGSICRNGGLSCKRGNTDEIILVANMNNVSFHLPPDMATPILESQYYHHQNGMDTLHELSNGPPVTFNFTDRDLIPFGPKEMALEPTSRAKLVRRFRHGATVDVVFQSTGMLQGDSNPMHLHGHDMFVLAQGLGNFDAARDVATYNLVDPPRKNTVLVPNLGWAAVRFVADNPGAWFIHCHYEFHLSMGMSAVFIVEDGPTVDTSLPPPPVGF
ncbi:hypothetical protein PR202_ga22599 [Eleusine coracana subsp. coracana]|uniref:laccase n=1 Tax=Eleusine coracana subsp. coracana TaxID=191504 RepID=A0AAV5D3H4_ELECO|nr:hypothetical protein PR202_ga22599 [Eleusine coracana subsp. coracana]